jgi:hypothetical protein
LKGSPFFLAGAQQHGTEGTDKKAPSPVRGKWNPTTRNGEAGDARYEWLAATSLAELGAGNGRIEKGTFPDPDTLSNYAARFHTFL